MSDVSDTRQPFPCPNHSGPTTGCPKCRESFERFATARDDVDYVLRWLRQTNAPENIVGLQLRALETLGGCGCDYELVEDGAVQRVRWFHGPGCPLA